MVFDDCPICLDVMDKADAAHPLQCSNHCGYNFCKHCIESYLSSSQDDYMEASDGSQQVKVWLHCPSCRSDLTSTIRDTLLLRKVDSLNDKLQNMKEQQTNQCSSDEAEENDEDESLTLTDSEKRLEEALQSSDEIHHAVSESRRREARYLGFDPIKEEKKDNAGDNDHDDEEAVEDVSWSMSSSFEEIGFEADLISGIHNSFRCPRSPIDKRPPTRQLTPMLVEQSKTDKTLFYGLDHFLPDDDRVYLAERMLSGDPNGLAEAAEILANVTMALKTGGPFDTGIIPSKNQKIRKLQKKSSIFGLVRDVQAVHEKEEKAQTQQLLAQAQFLQTPMKTNGTTMRRNSITSNRRAQLQRRQSLVLMAKDQKDFPLPVRLPKFVECDSNVAKQQLRLVDHEWDGTVLDAFSKIRIGFQNRIRQPPASSHKGVLNVLGGTEARIELPGQARVLLARVHREIGQQGATKGDVLTHINGALISGKTVQEVRDLLERAIPRANGKITMVLNAERSVAEGLRRRAMAKAELSK